ncbi:MAG TPA: sulfatase-like hydrolase/transferase [Parafilimonas sp.]|nr:sulfatase-like hydrolase/transferase [Parafilimonas sp.]
MTNFCRFVLLCCSLLNVSRAEAQRPYNVIFIIVDDMSIAIDAFGNPQAPSPNFQRLMQHGVLFKTTYVSYPLCEPSRTALFSGIRPDTNGVVNNGTTNIRWKLGSDFRFFPEYFHDHGYRTEAFGKVGPCGEEDQISWDHIFKADHEEGHFDHVPTWWIDTSAKTFTGTMGGINVDSLSVKIDHPAATPYLYALGLSTHNAFTPIMDSWNMTGDSTGTELVPLDRYGTKTNVKGYQSALIKLPGGPPDDISDIPAPAFNKDFYPQYTDQQVRDIRHAYFAELLEADMNLKTVIDELDKTNAWENTVVVFCSDHGLMMGEHGGLFLKNTLFEEALRIPFVVCAPGKLRGAVCEQPVEMIDLYPTLVELCGLPLKRGMQGVSLVPLLENPDIPLHDAVFSQRALDLDKAKYGDPQARAVRTVKYHYNNWGDFGEELYDIQNDPHEYTNLASDPAYAAVLQDMRKLLAEFMGAHEPVTQPLFVFPNPATGTVTISYHSITRANVHLKIYDAVGKLVFTKQEVASPGENRYQVFLGDLKTGAFILQLDNGDSPQQAKIIIQR